MLTNADYAELTAFRRDLHKVPELSGEEVQTAATIAGELAKLNPDQLITGLGGHGVAAVFEGSEAGETVLFRAELDGLPIHDEGSAAWVSTTEGKGHLCGHDGHMTMLLGLGRILARNPISSGRVVLMFQPAEEDGSGAKAVVADPAYQAISPDWAFAIHNEPGLPFGYVGTKAGIINCASLGLAITLKGKTSHAAEPELGTSPIQILDQLLPQLKELGVGGELDDDFQLVTITHINVGEPSFGISPSDAVIYATLRAAADAPLEDMTKQAMEITKDLCAPLGLDFSFDTCDEFAASINDPDAAAIATTAMDALNIPYGDAGVPMRASEDFGVFGWQAKAAMLCLGPGEDYVALHRPDYDFHDDLMPIGVSIFNRIARDLLG